jgi:hypothetical protein
MNIPVMVRRQRVPARINRNVGSAARGFGARKRQNLQSFPLPRPPSAEIEDGAVVHIEVVRGGTEGAGHD